MRFFFRAAFCCLLLAASALAQVAHDTADASPVITGSSVSSI